MNRVGIWASVLAVVGMVATPVWADGGYSSCYKSGYSYWPGGYYQGSYYKAGYYQDHYEHVKTVYIATPVVYYPAVLGATYVAPVQTTVTQSATYQTQSAVAVQAAPATVVQTTVTPAAAVVATGTATTAASTATTPCDEKVKALRTEIQTELGELKALIKSGLSGGATVPAGSDGVPAGLTKVVSSRCLSCHNGASAKGGLDLSDLAKVAKAQRYAAYTQVNIGAMPKLNKAGATEAEVKANALSNDEVDLFLKWALAGK